MNAYKSHIVRLLLMALLVLPALTSCYDVGDECEVLQNSDNVNYINVTVAVSTSNSAMTRANMPQGGEDGDGSEKGIDPRENYVKGVTLIFYQDAANTNDGINATEVNAQNTTIDYVVYYSVERDDNVPANHHLPGEVYYTTGDRQLSSSFRVDKKYRMLVVANADLTSMIIPGVTTLAQVRDMTLKKVYTGSGFSVDASEFVMTSEKDVIIDFGNSIYDKEQNRFTFKLDNVHIERMAARIDYWARGATKTTGTYFYKPNDMAQAKSVDGYVYDIPRNDGNTDHFVLTRIVPFNMNMGNGLEYFFKRTNDESPYLADESTTNWVIDPYTSLKNATSSSTWTSSFSWIVNPMANYVGGVETPYAPARLGTSAGTDGLVSVTLASETAQDVGGYDDIILAYPKENTLAQGSLLFYYATGLAFEGYYYHSGYTTTSERRVYYHYLRHQGESSNAYQALQLSTLDKTATCGSSPAMNYGVVRNNIYRVEITGFNEKDAMNLQIKVKKWDKFEHEVIYM